jgi:hypothetical protein
MLWGLISTSILNSANFLQQKAKTYQQHQVNYLLNSIAEIEENLITIYQDQNNAMKDELNSMRGANMFGSFYGTLKNMNEYHHKYPNAPSEGAQVTVPQFEVSSFSPSVLFTSSLPFFSL